MAPDDTSAVLNVLVNVAPVVDVIDWAEPNTLTNVPASYSDTVIVGVPEFDPFFANTVTVCVAALVSGFVGLVIVKVPDSELLAFSAGPAHVPAVDP